MQYTQQYHTKKKYGVIEIINTFFKKCFANKIETCIKRNKFKMAQQFVTPKSFRFSTH